MGLIQLKLTYIQRGVQEILKKSREVQKEDTYSVDKSKAEEVRRNSLETFSKARDWVEDEEGLPKPKRKRGNGSKTFEFLMLMRKAETKSEYKKEQLTLKAELLAIQKQENGKSTFTAYSTVTNQQCNSWPFPATKWVTTKAKPANDDSFNEFTATGNTIG